MIRLPDPARPYQVSFMERPVLVFAGAVALAIATLMILRWLAPLELALQNSFFQTTVCPDAGAALDNSRRCGFFPFRESAFWQTVRDVGFNGPLVIVGIGSLYFLWPKGGAPAMTPARLAPLVVAASGLWAGSIGIVNFVVKPIFGRPRPKQLELFGGADSYVLPGNLSDQCSVNCSFVSGESSTAFALVLFALLLPAAWRKFGVPMALILAVFISGLRVAFGGHFLSDVIMAWWVIGLVALATAWLLQTAMGGAFLEQCCGLLNRWRGVARAQV